MINRLFSIPLNNWNFKQIWKVFAHHAFEILINGNYNRSFMKFFNDVHVFLGISFLPWKWLIHRYCWAGMNQFQALFHTFWGHSGCPDLIHVKVLFEPSLIMAGGESFWGWRQSYLQEKIYKDLVSSNFFSNYFQYWNIFLAQIESRSQLCHSLCLQKLTFLLFQNTYWLISILKNQYQTQTNYNIPINLHWN